MFVELYGPLFDTVDHGDLGRNDVIALQVVGNVPEMIIRAETIEAQKSVAENNDMIIRKH